MKGPREDEGAMESNKTAKTGNAAKMTVVSSPGKVMIAGGYVVLEQPNVACVAAVSARVYVTASGGDLLDEVNGPWKVRVVSGQMGETRMYQLTFGETASIERLDAMPANPYAEAALLNSFAVARHLKGKFCVSELCIYGDNAFYAPPPGVERKDQATFAPISRQSDGAGDHSAEVQKTGLGSSAALVTSLVAAILAHNEAVSLPAFAEDRAGSSAVSEDDLALVHCLSQHCHCLAQGKIGSGFDVASATYGCIKYVRFSQNLLEGFSQGSSVDVAKLHALVSAAGKRFDHTAEPWKLPPGLDIMVGDVRGGGSSTTSMVRAVNAWRAEKGSAAKEVWSGLCLLSGSVSEHVRALSAAAQSDPEAYASALQRWTSEAARQRTQANQAADTAVEQRLDELQRAFSGVRCGMRAMGEAAGVPIEPPPQQNLLDITTALPPVIGGAVPGAGGFDAVFAILKDSAEARETVCKAWDSWHEGGAAVQALPIRCSPQGVVQHPALPT